VNHQLAFLALKLKSNTLRHIIIIYEKKWALPKMTPKLEEQLTTQQGLRDQWKKISCVQRDMSMDLDNL
jgi:hypothetical protein